MDRADYPRVVLLAFVWLVVPFLLFPIAQQHIDSALTGMLNAATPIFSAAIATVLLRSLPRLRQAAGIALGFAGTIAIGLPAARLSADAAWGVLLVVAATFFYGIALNLAVPLQQRYGAPAVMMRALGVATAATAPFGLAGLAGSRWSLAPVVAVAVLGVVGTGAAFVLMAALVGRGGRHPRRGGHLLHTPRSHGAGRDRPLRGHPRAAVARHRDRAARRLANQPPRTPKSPTTQPSTNR